MKNFVILTFCATVLAACAAQGNNMNSKQTPPVLLSSEDGFHTYLLPDSLKESDEGLRTAALEMRGGTEFLRQQIVVDCTRQLSAIVQETAWDAHGNQLGETQDYDLPDFSVMSANQRQEWAIAQTAAQKALVQKICAK